MAPPPHRRPGFSRRAQYGLFIGYVVAVIGVVAAAGLLLIARIDPVGFAGVRGLATDLTTPLTAAGRSMVRGIADLGAGAAAYWRAGTQNAALSAELERARARLVAARAIEFENRRLKRLLRVADASGDPVVTVRIVGSSLSSPRRLATITAGADDGVKVGQPVRSPEGLVGRVVETGRISARLLLLTDPASNVPVRVVRGGAPALATGRGDGTLELRALAADPAPFRRGDVLITSGTGGIYPPAIPVALVTAVGRDNAVATPLADPARLDYAIVVRPFQPDIPAPAAQAEAP